MAHLSEFSFEEPWHLAASICAIAGITEKRDQNILELMFIVSGFLRKLAGTTQEGVAKWGLRFWVFPTLALGFSRLGGPSFPEAAQQSFSRLIWRMS